VINILSLENKVFMEYKSLVIQMNDEFHAIEVARTTFEFLCDV
jgi:hypothetical protein